MIKKIMEYNKTTFLKLPPKNWKISLIFHEQLISIFFVSAISMSLPEGIHWYTEALYFFYAHAYCVMLQLSNDIKKYDVNILNK